MTLSTSLRILVTTSALALSALAVQAQAHDGKSTDQHQRGSGEHAEQLVAKLNLTPAQQQAWEQYQAVVQSTQHERGTHGDKQNLSDAQKAEKRQLGQEHKQARKEAKEAFLAQLSQEQQDLFHAQGHESKSKRGGQQHAS